MNIQQIKYIVALDRLRNFARAAEACDVSQPTLSAMVQKLEEELDVRIFERTNKTVTTTAAGVRIIQQAKRSLMELDRIGEIVSEEKGLIEGHFRLSVGPTIAPYILPKFIRHYRESYPSVTLSIQEMKANNALDALLSGEIDAVIAIADNFREGVLEIPLYTERFYVYLAESCWRKLPTFKPENLEHENMWIMKDAQCMLDSAFSFCKAANKREQNEARFDYAEHEQARPKVKARAKGNHIYEAGSIDTLIRIVDENGGFTIIPEMHLSFLTDKQRENIRKIEGNYLSQRRVSLYIKEDYIRQRMLNTIVDTLKAFLPKEMLGEGILKYGIKL